jgi:hypothetical protein
MSKARDILASESEMLGQIVPMINKFAAPYKGFEKQNLECWGDHELSKYRDVDKHYITLTDDELDAALGEEIDILNKCLTALGGDVRASDSDAVKYWKTNLKENIWYTEETRKRVRVDLP